MSNTYFQFKQFTIRHDKCAMKVGTDGVLLGAWVQTDKCRNILDVGTGSGLIALMLAQRSHALIDAIDIDADACLQATENVQISPFSQQITVHHEAFAEYSVHCNKIYDLIASNPPFFIDSLKCPDKKRSTARHSETLLATDLIKSCHQILAPTGRLALILPYEQLSSILNVAANCELYTCRQTDVIPHPDAAPKRFLIELSPTYHTPIKDHLIIEYEHNNYTEEYKTLTRAFYLKM
jgi:tRNA1Val (adenine37-N6)-methyltransferase